MTEETTTMNDEGLAAPVRTHELEDASAYYSRSSTLADAASVADHLVARKPDVMSELEAKRLDDLVSVRKQAYAVLGRRAGVSAAVMLPRRNAALGAASRINMILNVLSGSTTTETVAEVAQVRAAVFGHIRDLTRLKPRVLWTTMNTIVEKLDAAPALRSRLEALVTAGAVTELLVAHHEHGMVLGLLGEKGEELPVFDIRLLTTRLDQRIDRYAASVLATVDPGDTASEHRAEAALRPILEAREVTARRRARGAAEAEGDEEEVEESTEPEAPEVDAVLGTD